MNIEILFINREGGGHFEIIAFKFRAPKHNYIRPTAWAQELLRSVNLKIVDNYLTP